MFLVPLLLLLVIGAWLVNTILVAVRPPKNAVKEPSCENCRYPVAGLTELRCPECGSDLRLTGIITRDMEARRRGSTAGAVLALLALWLILAQFVSLPIAVLVRGWSANSVLEGVVAIGAYVGWLLIGLSVALWIVKRRRAMLARVPTAASPAPTPSAALAVVRWACLWTGIGMFVFFPISGYVLRMGMFLEDEDWRATVAAIGVVCLWGVIGGMVGARILRRHRRATAGPPKAHNPDS